MTRQDILKKIAQGAQRDKRNRRDRRYLEVMGFLVAKGFLRINQPILLFPNMKVRIADAIWAGKNVEPRILEVLPAAILRLPRHFDLNAKQYPELFIAVEMLKKQATPGIPLWGIPYDKIRVWANLPLPDRRTKFAHEKKVTRTYRFKPETLARLKELSQKLGCTETEAVEKAIAKVFRLSSYKALAGTRRRTCN